MEDITKLSDEEVLRQYTFNSISLIDLGGNSEEFKKLKQELLKRLSNNKVNKTINFYSPEEIEDIKKQAVEEYKNKVSEEINKMVKYSKSDNVSGFKVIKLINNLK